MNILYLFGTRKQLTYPVWINADILPGPVLNIMSKPVDAHRFLQGCKQLPCATVSPGWTTLWGPIYQIGKYTSKHIDQMVNVMNANEINCIEHSITFPVRAGPAAHSRDTLTDLLQRMSQNRTGADRATLTLWSSENDYVHVPQLQQLIDTVGHDRVYVDVPASLRQQLKL